MKRPLFIGIGIVIILLVVGIWVYLLLFGSPSKSGDVFANLGLGFNASDTTSPIEEELTSPDYTVDVGPEKLQQLTTKPVAGFVDFVENDKNMIRYAEQGTGHIYDIDLENGEETLVSRTTIPRIQNAHFSPDGSTVALVALNGYVRDTLFGTIDKSENKIIGVNLPPNADNVSVPTTSKVYYTYIPNDELIGYEQTTSGASKELFKLPFKSVTILWSSPNFKAFNRPAKNLLGYLYEIKNGTYNNTEITGYGLVADQLGKYIGYSVYVNNQLETGLYDLAAKNNSASPVIIIPEKCTTVPFITGVWCAAPLERDLDIEEWYKGTITSNDFLWHINTETNEADLAQSFIDSSGRNIDVSSIASDKLGQSLLFTNKTDGTLWRFLVN